MMKKIMMSLLIGVAVLTGFSCYAAVPADQLVLGGIRHGATIREVESVYGRPGKMERDVKVYGEKLEYEYGDTLEFEFINGKVTKIQADDSSNAKTQAGIGLGSDVAALKNAYGEPDAVHGEDYIYYASGLQGIGLKFEVKYGRVAEIKCGPLY